jgi:hypothetical protein
MAEHMTLDDLLMRGQLDGLEENEPQGIELDALDDEMEVDGERLVFGPRLEVASKDWRGVDLGTPNSSQVAAYGTFEDGLPRGLCLHFTSGHTWSRAASVPGAGPLEKFRNGVARKMYDVMTFARRKTAKGWYNMYYVIDLLGGIHQDSEVDERGIHGNSANKYAQGVELTTSGRLTNVAGQFYRSFDCKNGRLLKSTAVPFPEWARRTIVKKDYNIRPGTYALFTPEQVRAICRLHANLVAIDRQRGIYQSEHKLGESGVTSHDLHSDMRTDVGGALFCNVREFGELLARYVEALGGPGSAGLIDPARHEAAFAEIVAASPAWQQVYRDWQHDVVHYWA